MPVDSQSIRRRGSIAVVVPLLAVVAACGGGATASPSVNADPGGDGTAVNVTLQEWAVVPAQASVPAGTVTFAVTNDGPVDPHELVVFKTDLGHRALPTREDGGVDEEGEGVELIGEIEEFDPGATESGSFELAAGNYVLICNLVEEEDGELESHYKLGMSTEFTVE